MAEALLELTTLGGAGLRRVGDPRPDAAILGPGKPFALLVYLALAPRRTATRDELMDLLWAEAEPERARATLRQTLFQLRTLLGSDLLRSEGRSLVLDAAVGIDVLAFRAAVAGGDVERALALYGGAFLVEFGVPGGRAFEEWAASERAQLEAAYLRFVEAAVRRHLHAGRFAAAQRLARGLRDLHPQRQSAWRLLLDALRAGGEHVAAAVEASALREMLARDEVVPEPATVERLRAPRDTLATMDERRSGGAAAPVAFELVAELVGREREFAALLREWEALRERAPRFVLLSGGAGFGKTRLLGDFAARLRTVRARVVVVRARAGERDLREGLASDLAVAIGALPGASGISPTPARTLLGLAPALSASFRGEPVHLSGDEAVRLRALALTELIDAVAEERPLALLIDDLHWADPSSLALLRAALGRVRERVLVVGTSRGDGAALASPDALRLTLAGLDREQVRSFLVSVGLRLDDPAALDRVSGALQETTAGSPLEMLNALQHALERGLLRQDGLALGCDDVDALLDAFRAGEALQSRLARLAGEERALLDLLGASGIGRPADVLARAADIPRERAESLLLTLAAQRLVTSEGEGEGEGEGERWDFAHDTVREAVLRLAALGPEGPDRLRAAHCALARALAEGDADEGALRAAVRHLVAGGAAREVGPVVRRWVAHRRALGDRRSASVLVGILMGDDATPDARRHALRSLSLRERLGPSRLRAASTLAAGLAIVASLAAWRATTRPQLYVAVPPLSLTERTGLQSYVLNPTPVVELRDAADRVIATSGDTMTARLVSGSGRLSGMTSAPIVGGRAVFPTLGIDSLGPKVLEFSVARLGASVRVPFADDRALDDTVLTVLSLVEGRLNGRRLDPVRPEVTVPVGGRISGLVTFDYTTAYGDATVWFGAAPTWGEPARSVVSFGALSTPARHRRRVEALDIAAPPEPGRYYLMFVSGAEPDARFIFSSTNWVMGEPRWGDGNDLARTPGERIERAMREGWMEVRVLKRLGGRVDYFPGLVGMAAIRVIAVEGERGSGRSTR